MVYDRDPTLWSSSLPFSVVPDSEEVSLKGTVGGSVASDRFQFRSAQDSNVAVRVVDERLPKVEIGVYYV